MNPTKIEYLTHTWNPVAMRCTPVSEGCKNCWHLTKCDMMQGNPLIPEYIKNIHAGIIGPQLIESRLKIPKGKPKRIGVQFMGDLFHEDVGKVRLVHYPAMSAFKCVIETVRAFPEHTFVVLTKRAEAMARLFDEISYQPYDQTAVDDFKGYYRDIFPLPNLWLGVTAENQQQYDDRWAFLAQIQAAVRFVSMEPLLGSIDFLKGHEMHPHWVIAGCESGPGRRPAKAGWFRDVKNQCVSAGVPFFLKQMVYKDLIYKMPMLDGRVWDQYPDNSGFRNYPETL